MIPQAQQWSPPWNNQCTLKYAALIQIPLFCKKGCDSDGETWEDSLGECDEICYKDPVLKEQQRSAYIDHSPGAASYSEECFHACVAGCGYKKVNRVHPTRPSKPLAVDKPPAVESRPPHESGAVTDIPSIFA